MSGTNICLCHPDLPRSGKTGTHKRQRSPAAAAVPTFDLWRLWVPDSVAPRRFRDDS
jgi:hypothetical protein